MEDDDDFTFPTVAAAGPGGRLGSGDVVGDAVVVARMPLQLPVPDLATAAAPLWPFAGSPKQATAPPPPSTAPVTKDDEEVPELGSNNGRRKEHRAEEDDDDDEDRRRRRVAADEERMDLLWAGATTTTTAPPPQSIRSGAGHSQPPPPPPKPKPEPEPEQPRAEAEDDKRRAAAVADAERMDKLWESFNEELLLRHALSKAAAAAADRAGAGRAADPADRWYLCSHSPSDAESDGTTAASSPAERRGYGCAPTMLRASSRAGGAGQFCGSPRGGRRRGGRGAAAGWALLLRLFRRLFAVDKAPASASSRSHASIYVP